MATFAENEKIPELPFIPRTLLCQGSWGEIWRASHETFGSVLFIAYSNGEGEDLFSSAYKGLVGWKQNVEASSHRLLKILDISDGAIPYLIVEDTGEKSLAESLEHHHGHPSLEALAKAVKEISLAVAEAAEWGLTPIGLTPELVMKCTDGSPVQWKLLPLAPGAPIHQRASYCAKYLPPSTLGGDLINEPQNCDTYALGQIWMDLIRMYQKEAGEIEKRVLLECGLKEAVAGALQKIEGEFRPPSELAEIAQHWLTRFHRKKDEVLARVSSPKYEEENGPSSTDENILAQFSSDEEHTMILPSKVTSDPNRPSTSAIPLGKMNFQRFPTETGGADISEEPTLIPGTLPATDYAAMAARTPRPVKAKPPAKAAEVPQPADAEPPRPPMVRTPGGWTPPEAYEVIETLGSGSMARVYKARHKVLDRIVVLKVSTPKPGAGIEDNPQRLLLEARTIAKLEHEHIVRINDCFIHMGQVHLVMEYVDGMTLGDLLKVKDPNKLDVKYRKMLAASGRLKPSVAMDIGVQAASALDYSHKHGIIHRDVKPTNLLLTLDGKAKLFDFSIAKIQTGEAESMTATGIILGSPAYMSPEQVERQPLDGRADIYALGCVLYSALAGRPPFTDKSDVMLCLKQLKETAPPVNTIQPEISEDLARIVDRCLYKDRAERYGTALDLSMALKRLKDFEAFNAPEKKSSPRPVAKEAIPQKGAAQVAREVEPPHDVESGNGGFWVWVVIVLIITIALAYYFFIY
ncbi:protein kinase [Candidatus Sumerlaeota bacterium]|nr:protein kinase [Candidatus Sumerlaeota bacterium]